MNEKLWQQFEADMEWRKSQDRAWVAFLAALTKPEPCAWCSEVDGHSTECMMPVLPLLPRGDGSISTACALCGQQHAQSAPCPTPLSEEDQRRHAPRRPASRCPAPLRRTTQRNTTQANDEWRWSSIGAGTRGFTGGKP